MNLPQVTEIKSPRLMDAAGEYLLYYEFVEQIAKKEKPHAYLDHCNSTRTMVTRIFRPECLCWLSTLGQCRPHAARDCRHSHYFETVRGHLDRTILKFKN